MFEIILFYRLQCLPLSNPNSGSKKSLELIPV